MNTSAITGWCADNTFPDNGDFYAALTKEDDLFIHGEGACWDFKETWPFSMSDDYFGGIVRLISAFANSSGGMIVFGVHDVKRTGGHNKVIINFDKFLSAVKDGLGAAPSISLRSYFHERAGDVDVLLIKSRDQGVAPYRFQKQIGKYQPGIIWARVGHEVRMVEPQQYPLVFCRSRTDEAGGSAPLDGSIPPSPATLKGRFVGRTEVLDRLFHWFEGSDEPRVYLYGKGGSGKTTIAYEFARLLRDHGSSLRMHEGEKPDTVIFVSAKEKSLAVADGRIVDADNPDFSNEIELLRSILYYGGWSRDDQYLRSASLETLRKDVKDYFDINSALIVIDDIDTLTTKGIESGSDFLYKTLCRSSRRSKIVYTLRNVPSLSLLNAIEVPGLGDADYAKFVEECSMHFNVPSPSAEFRNRRLSQLSERRPLIIEIIVALRRTAGNYDQAVKLFEQQAGDAIRDYVFLREWDALTSNAPRLLLAALSELGEPTSFRDLQSVLQHEPSAISDAIGAVREMFLTIDEAGSEAMYSLQPLTKAFVSSKRAQLVGHSALHSRVNAFRRHVAVSNPRVAGIVTQIERLLPPRGGAQRPEKVIDAIRIVSDRNLPPFVTEDPLFRTLLGYVHSCRSEPNFGSMREAFEYSISLKFEPDFKYLRSWFNAERNSGIHDGWCLRIADLVLDGKRYSEREKIEMIGRKATSLFSRGQERLHTASVDALKDMQEALRLHLRGFRLRVSVGDSWADASEKYARNTAFQLFGILAKSDVPWEFIDIVDSVAKGGEIYLDPIENPIEDATALVLRTAIRPDVIARTKQHFRGLSATLDVDKVWLSDFARERTLQAIKIAVERLDAKQRTMRRSGDR